MSILAYSSAKPVTRLSLGAYRAVLSGNVVPAGFIEYGNILEVYDQSGNRVYAAAAEVNRLAGTLGGGSHFLCAYDDGKHLNYGASDQWADTGKFLNAAVDMVRKRFDIPATEPALPAAVPPALPAAPAKPAADVAQPATVFAEPAFGIGRPVASRTGLMLGAGVYGAVVLAMAVGAFLVFAVADADVGRLTLLPEVLLNLTIGWRFPLFVAVGALSGWAAARVATRSSEGGVDLAPLHIVRWARSLAGVLIAKYRLRRHGILSGTDAPAWTLPAFFFIVAAVARVLMNTGVLDSAGPVVIGTTVATLLLADTILINVVALIAKR